MFEKQKKNYKEHIMSTLPSIVGGIWCGALVGFLVFFFKLLGEMLVEISHSIYAAAAKNATVAVFVFLGLILLGSAMFVLHKCIPEVKGGGIPRSRGSVVGMLRLNWLRTLLGTISGSFLSFFCGVPVGAEGPSVLIGTSIGSFCGGSFKQKEAWSRFMMTGGAGAGFAVATGAPLSAILFVLEEIHRRISPLLLIMISSSVLSAAMVNDFLCRAFGINPILFEFGIIQPIKLSHLGYLLLLALLIAAAVTLFDIVMAGLNAFVGKRKKKRFNYIFIVSVFLLTGVIGIMSPDLLYSGMNIISDIISEKTLIYLVALLAIRLVFMFLVTSSGVTGGMFIPTLAIGALFGALCAKLLVLIGLPGDMYGTVVLLSMTAFMGGTMRIPLTATAFFIESTAQFSNILYISLVMFIVSFVAESINSNSFYETTLANLKKEQNRGLELRIMRFEMTVSKGAFVSGKAVRDIVWPPASIITGITHAGDFKRVMDEDGEQVLGEGDVIILRAEVYDIEEMEKYLYGLVGKEYQINSDMIE